MTRASERRILSRYNKKQQEHAVNKAPKWPVEVTELLTAGKPDKWECQHCGHVDTEILVSPSPFAPEAAQLTACISCKTVNQLIAVGDEPTAA